MFGPFKKKEDDSQRPAICSKFARNSFDSEKMWLQLECTKPHEDPKKARYKVSLYQEVLDEKLDAHFPGCMGAEVKGATLEHAKEYMRNWEEKCAQQGYDLSHNLEGVNAVYFDAKLTSSSAPERQDRGINDATPDTRIANLNAIGGDWTQRDTSNLTGGPNLRTYTQDVKAAEELIDTLKQNGIEATLGRKGENHVIIVPEDQFTKVDCLSAKTARAPSVPSMRR